MYGFGYGLTIRSRRSGSLNWAAWAAGLSAAELLDIDFAKLDRHFQNLTGQTLADDPGESIALAMDSGAWGGLDLAGIVGAQPELRGTGTIGIVGSTTPATYDASTGAGTVSRSTYPGDQSYVTFPVVAGAYYELDIQCSNLSGVSVRSAAAAVSLVNTAGDTTRRKYRIASTTSELMIFASANATSTPFTMFSLKLVPGNHGTQTGGAIPARQAGGVCRFDGSDDNLLTSFAAGSGGITLLYHGTIPATVAATQSMMGASGSGANRCWLAVIPAGVLAAGVGSLLVSDVKGTKDIRGKSVVAAMAYDGTSVRLYLHVDGVPTLEYEGAANGAPHSSMPFRIGAYNNNGTAGSAAAIDGRSFKAARKAMTFNDFARIAAALAA